MLFFSIYIIRITHKLLPVWGGDVWSSPSIAGQERENERVSLGIGRWEYNNPSPLPELTP